MIWHHHRGFHVTYDPPVLICSLHSWGIGCAPHCWWRGDVLWRGCGKICPKLGTHQLVTSNLRKQQQQQQHQQQQQQGSTTTTTRRRRRRRTRTRTRTTTTTTRRGTRTTFRPSRLGFHVGLQWCSLAHWCVIRPCLEFKKTRARQGRATWKWRTFVQLLFAVHFCRLGFIH